MYTFGLANFDMISSGSPGDGISEQRVKDLINQNNNTVVQSQIQNAVSQSASEIQTQVGTAINQATSNMQSYTDTAVNQATSGVQTQIDTAVTNASENYDDTKIYATYDDMLADEPTGREDVLFFINDEDNTRYIWNGSEYTAIEGRIGYNQIQGLFS